MIEFLTSEFKDIIIFLSTVEPGYIYLMLFLIAFIENIFPPFPGDTFTIVGGYLAAVGKLAFLPTLLVVSFGTLSSVMLIYALGYRGGYEYFERKNYRFFSVGDLSRVKDWFDRFGAGILIASRFIVGARVAIAIGAGISKYSPLRMTVLTFCSGLIFHGLLLLLAYAMHAYIERLVDGFDLYTKIILVIVAAVIILWIILIWRRKRNGNKKA